MGSHARVTKCATNILKLLEACWAAEDIGRVEVDVSVEDLFFPLEGNLMP